ncbi:unnamed protein product [Angiostrongylus costaricensis]|uniref:SH3 domain-containing protein n=1 Tax=Angiostrongylus costaricensis TaxID=334426 RepID=A0A158PML3_ANGCS|nr:unnamed protein product [Angiostrongylus costaricensis]
MKSLSLDCQEMPPRINTTNRSPMRTKIVGAYPRRKNDSSDLSDWERSCSPCNGNSRRSSAAPALNGGYIVIHEYAPPNAVAPLVLGERVYVVDNGDPDWLHGFREHDRLYRDQVVFAQPDSLHDGKVTIRTAHRVFAPCPLSSLALI